MLESRLDRMSGWQIVIVDFRVSKIDAIEQGKEKSGKGREGVPGPSSISVKRNASLEDRKCKKKRHSHTNLFFFCFFCSRATFALAREGNNDLPVPGWFFESSRRTSAIGKSERRNVFVE